VQVLPGIGAQNAQLDKENAAAGRARTALFQELWQVFLYGGEDLALCIVHSHVTLKERERIVSNDISNAKGGNGPVSISGPSTEIVQVEAKSWYPKQGVFGKFRESTFQVQPNDTEKSTNRIVRGRLAS